MKQNYEKKSLKGMLEAKKIDNNNYYIIEKSVKINKDE